MSEVTREEFEQLWEEVAEVKRENERLQQENDQLHDRVDDLEDSNERLHQETAKLRQRVDELESQTERVSSNTEGAFNQISRLKERLSKLDTPTPEGGETTVQQHETHLEEVVSWPDEVSAESLSPNQQRARHIAANLDDYSRQTPKGRVMDTSDLRTVMSARYDITHSETINRVREFFDDLGGDDVEIKEPSMAGFDPDTAHDRRGKRVVISDDLAQRLRQASQDGHDVVTEATA
jgi:chromosome segregation ATPase